MKLPRPVAVGLALVCCLVVSVGAGADPVAAHEGEGEIEVLSVVRSGATVSVDVRVTFIADGHGVPDATVTAVVPGGTPVSLDAQAEEGRYAGSLDAEEDVSIRVSSVAPPVSVEVQAPPMAVVTTEPNAPASTTTAPASTEAGPTSTSVAPTQAGADEDGSGASRAVLVGGGVAVVALALVLVMRARGGTGGTDPTP